MSLQLFGHPFSSYTMKALIALYENATPFDFRMLDQDHPENAEELARRWPLGKFALLVKSLLKRRLRRTEVPHRSRCGLHLLIDARAEAPRAQRPYKPRQVEEA